MASLRRELSEYASACEQLMTDAVPFTREELQWIGYYATEIANLSDQRVRLRRPTVTHERHTLGDYAVTSRALLFADGLLKRDKDLIRLLTYEVMRDILDGKGKWKA